MDKEEAYQELFKSLKLSFKNASIYFEEHPAFIKSVEEVKDKIDLLLNFSSPLKIGVTSRSLFVEGKHWEQDKIYVELANIFHLRKIKSIEIKKGITIEELILFLKKTCLPSKDILKEGGINHILKNEKIMNLSVEELDYSQLLRGEGEEIKDIWPYLLKEAIDQEDSQKITEFADNFERVVGNVKTEDLIENEELRVNIEKFFTFLKDKEKDKFSKCAIDLFKSILRSKDISQERNFSELGVIFKDLNEDELTSLLGEEISTDEDFDSMSFQVFCQLIEKNKHKEIASSLAELFQRETSLKSSPQTRKKIKELFSEPSHPFISEIYRDTFSSLIKDVSSEERVPFDLDLLRRNYRFILLNLLAEESRKDQLTSFLEKILGIWESIVSERDIEYLKCVVEVMDKKRSDLASEPIFNKVNKHISDFLDHAVHEGYVSSDLDYFMNYLKESSLDFEAYFDKIFMEKKIGPHILELFFELFPDNLLTFQEKLREKSSDTEFLKKIIESLGEVDSPLSLESLKHIFSFGGDLIKVKALQAMQQLFIDDANFLLPLLKKGERLQKKEALVILARDENTKEKAKELLLSFPSPLGMKNALLQENIRIIDEAGFKEAKDYLLVLSKKRFFWNKSLRREALRVLGKWNERKG